MRGSWRPFYGRGRLEDVGENVKAQLRDDGDGELNGQGDRWGPAEQGGADRGDAGVGRVNAVFDAAEEEQESAVGEPAGPAEGGRIGVRRKRMGGVSAGGCARCSGGQLPVRPLGNVQTRVG